jgi:hypothetical protein
MQNKHEIPLLGIIVLMLLFLGCARKKTEPETKAAPAPNVAVSNQIAAGYSYTVTNLRNNVSWSTDDSSWQQAGKGITLPAGAYIETGNRSMALLTGSIGDMVVLGERSKVRLSLEDLSRYASSGTGAVRGLRLIKGLATFDIRKSLVGFFVETPTATVKVKGTNFSVSYDEKSLRTNVKVFQGEVTVEDKKHSGSPELVLDPKEKAEDIGSAEPSSKKTMSENEIHEFITPAEMDSIKIDIWPAVSFPTQEESRETRVRLNETVHSQSQSPTTAVPTRTTDSAKSQARSAINGVKTGYTGQVEKEKAQYQQASETARKTVEAEKSKTSAALDSARRAYEKGKPAGSSHSGSGDMFDDMKRRRNSE